VLCPGCRCCHCACAALPGRGHSECGAWDCICGLPRRDIFDLKVPPGPLAHHLSLAPLGLLGTAVVLLYSTPWDCLGLQLFCFTALPGTVRAADLWRGLRGAAWVLLGCCLGAAASGSPDPAAVRRGGRRPPPETRRQQAQLFNAEGSGFDILVASDAVGMGLNLNIRRIVSQRSPSSTARPSCPSPRPWCGPTPPQPCPWCAGTSVCLLLLGYYFL